MPATPRESASSAATAARLDPATSRLGSIDVYRGIVMFLMLFELTHLSQLDKHINAPWARLVASQLQHVEWAGCSLHDLIQPSFSFLVGVSMVFSLAKRRADHSSFLSLWMHALSRSFVLISLGIFLRSNGAPQTKYTFMDTLTQIGMGYFFLFLIAQFKSWVQIGAMLLILVGHWVWFATAPLPPEGFDLASVGVAPDFAQEHNFRGFAAHWNKNTNVGRTVDVWWLNRFPRPAPFVFDAGGYVTINFIPTLATMILGLLAGQALQTSTPPMQKMRVLLVAAVGFYAAGWLLHVTGTCPSVKRIWTPAWVLVSGGWCFGFLAALHYIVDLRGWLAWSYPLRVIGANSIAAYCLRHLTVPFIQSSLKTHLGQNAFRGLGNPAFESVWLGLATLFVLWLILQAMYRRRMFIRL